MCGGGWTHNVHTLKSTLNEPIKEGIFVAQIFQGKEFFLGLMIRTVCTVTAITT